MDLGVRFAGQIVELHYQDRGLLIFVVAICAFLTLPISCVQTRVRQLMALLEMPKSILAQQLASKCEFHVCV